MSENRFLPIIEEEEIEIDDDFYEKIEAPKFVDLTKPDKRRPDDDRHWFCARFGNFYFIFHLWNIDTDTGHNSDMSPCQT